MDFNVTDYEILIDMVSDSTLQLTFIKLPLVEFWCNIKEEYPNLFEKAIKILLPFPTTNLCEVRFSSYTSTKTKYHNRLNAEADMRIQLSSIKPDIKEICKNVTQYHYSHIFCLGKRLCFH